MLFFKKFYYNFRIPGHSESILKTLLKLLSDLCPDESTIPDKQGALYVSLCTVHNIS